MDFLKTMLLYMSLMMATTVQGAQAPNEVPTPTPPPVVITAVTAQPGEEATLAPTVTPEVIAEPTAVPEPTITPNKAYRNLAFGARGEDVRKLQQALADMGYLTGNIDGAYGYQTRNAVMKFQEINGLKKDGVAGRETQTRLLEDPAAIPNPARVTPSPVPTATPGPDGLVPQMEDPRSIWVDKKCGAALVGSEALTAPVGVWQRGDALIVCVSDIAAASEDWVLTSEDATAVTLRVAGYEAAVQMLPVAGARDLDGYCEHYSMAVNGAEVALAQGDWMHESGAWYATVGCLEKALNADITWDEDERTLLVRVLPSELAEAKD